MKPTDPPVRAPAQVLLRVGICAAVLLAGIAGMLLLASFKKPPAKSVHVERALQVRVLAVHAEDAQVTISGYGNVRAVDVVPISAEVSGRIVEIYPGLDEGEIISKGRVIFRIDPRNYEAAYHQAAASVQQAQARIKRLEKQLEIDRRRVKTLIRSRDLAAAEFKRLRRLFEKDKVGSRSGVDAAERAFNNARDRADQMAEAVALYPLQIREAESSLKAARAAQSLAADNLARCTVRAPFNGRVATKSVERGQYVTSGQHLLTLADDSVLEIRVPIDSRDARRYLRFAENTFTKPSGWFARLVPVMCRIRWTQDPSEHVWRGRLDRVVGFDRQTRTLTVAVRIQADAVRYRGKGALPLVAGMFCRVEIPGKTLVRVYRIPRWAVSFQKTVFLDVSGRLKTTAVAVARIQGPDALISRGLQDGDRVIVTHLVNPLENSLLQVVSPQIPAQGS